MKLDLIHRLHATLPAVREWIEKTLEEYRPNAVSVINLSFPRLCKVFPFDLLTRAKAVVINGKMPFPPLSHMGLPEFSEMENMQMAGITFKDTFFVSHSHQTESLYFHELVHVIQWDRLGLDNLLLAYGAGFMQFGYRNNPLEEMAYSLQTSFDLGTLPSNTIEIVRKKTDAVWNGVSPLFSTI
ncbi:MAG: hypothetical protein AB1401_04385 [Thermodesulfobacteriota bacterium]